MIDAEIAALRVQIDAAETPVRCVDKSRHFFVSFVYSMLFRTKFVGVASRVGHAFQRAAKEPQQRRRAEGPIVKND